MEIATIRLHFCHADPLDNSNFMPLVLKVIFFYNPVGINFSTCSERASKRSFAENRFTLNNHPPIKKLLRFIYTGCRL